MMEGGDSMQKQRLRWLALVLTAVFLIAGCASGGSKDPVGNGGSGGSNNGQPTDTTGEPQFGGTLVVGTLTDVGNFNPLVSNSVTDSWVLNNMYPTLIVFNEAGERIPYFAKSWHYEDDGLKAVFVLRDDVTWDDGTPFTSADVKFTAELIMEHQVGLVGSMLGDVASVDAPDDHTVVFNLKQPYGPFLTSIGFWMKIVPKHAWEHVEDPNTYANNENIVSAGPFKLTKYEKGQYYRLDRVDNFPLAPAGKAYLDSIMLRVYPDMNTMILALKKGDIDAIGNPIPAASVKDVEGTPGLTIGKTASLGYAHMTYNLHNPHLAKQPVRQALIMATNKEAIQQIVLLGNAMSLPTVVSPVLGDSFNPDVKDFPFDPEAARNLLKEAGYTETNGVFADLEFDLIYDQGNVNISKWAKMVADDAIKAGIKINLNGMERNTYLDRARARDFDIYAGSWGIMDEPADYFALLFSPDGFINYGNVDDPDLMALVDEARYSTDPATTKAAVYKVQEYVQAQAYVNTLYVETYNLAYNTDKFAGYKIFPSDLRGFMDPLSLSNIHKVN